MNEATVYTQVGCAVKSVVDNIVVNIIMLAGEQQSMRLTVVVQYMINSKAQIENQIVLFINTCTPVWMG